MQFVVRVASGLGIVADEGEECDDEEDGDEEEEEEPELDFDDEDDDEAEIFEVRRRAKIINVGFKLLMVIFF